MANRVALLIRAGLAVLIALLGTRLPAPAASAAPAAGHTYLVDSTLDEPDADPALGACISTPSGQCTLRAAIMAANYVAGPNTILLPAGTYTLTRPGVDDTALVGDLDIGHDLTLQGAGAGLTIVDGNGAVTGQRVFQILSASQAVTITGLTIRGGQALSTSVEGEGGGLYFAGAGHVLLSGVVLEDNQAQNGGGVYADLSNTGELVLDHASVRANQARAGGAGAGGGVFAYLPGANSELFVRDSQVYSNTANGTGGGFYVDGSVPAVWAIATSQIYSNTAGSGAGLASFLSLALTDSRLHGNFAQFDGGALESSAPSIILRSQFDANTAHRFGGAIFDLSTGSNQEFVKITQSTFNGNYAQYGGAIYHDGFINPLSRLTLTNSTLSGNGAFRANGGSGSADGAGLYVYGGQAQLFNTTIANNHIDLGSGIHVHAGVGAGVYITASAWLTAESSLIANNTSSRTFQPPITEDDCLSSGTSGELGFDLILTTTNCFVTGPQTGLVIGQDPLLGPLQDNGGATPTQALLASSPAIDAGAPAGCTGAGGAPITTDQRGAPRADVRCDIGAYEVVPLADLAAGQRDQPDPVRRSAALTYTLAVTNTGPTAEAQVALTDTLPAGVSLRSAAASQGSCAGTAVIICTLGPLAASARLTVTLAVTPTAAGLITNTVTVSGDVFDPALGNNTASEATRVTQPLYLPLVTRGP